MVRLVVVENINASSSLEFISEIKQKGLISGIDFQWRFVPGDISGSRYARVEVEFFDEKHATFYQLKWGSGDGNY